jgi:hypothetical protein
VQRRDFLGAAAAVALAGTRPRSNSGCPRSTAPAQPQPVPARIGTADVEQIRATVNAMVDQLMELGRRLGGGAALGAVTRYLRWATGLLRARCPEHTGRELRVALADLYNVAGHSLHDNGRPREATRLLATDNPTRPRRWRPRSDSCTMRFRRLSRPC